MTRPDTADLIRRLSGDAPRARPLAPPPVRAAGWSVVSLLYLLVLSVAWARSTAVAPMDLRFVVEQAAALATGFTAAVAAFATVVPGRSRRLALVPLAPLAVWLVALGQQCARDWSGAGQLPAIAWHWACFPATIAAGLVPALVIVIMLRRGAPMTPRLTLTLAAVAVAGLANVAVRFVHAFDASLVVLTWHVGAVFALSAGVGLLGERVFSWQNLSGLTSASTGRDTPLR